MRKFLVLGFVTALVLAAQPIAAQPKATTAPEHFRNPNFNPDPDFVPPADYPAPDAEAAQAQFDTRVEEMEPEGDAFYVTNEEGDEITWTAIKNETATVLGYFRVFDGYVSFQNNKFVKAELLIDINSLDSGVPGRDNRIKSIFFQSMKPEMGTASLVLDKAEGDPTMASFQDGEPHPVTMSGNLTLGKTTVPVTAKLEIKWETEEEIWSLQTTEPLQLRVTDLKLDGAMPELMKECNHKSMGNLVKITCKLRFE